jgi:8-oxo-dGTP diphosphatase
MEEEKVQYYATLVFLARGEEALLGKKTRGIGKGRFNGPGGSIEKGESPKNSAIREVFEETGVRILPENLKKVAVVYFHNVRNGLEKFVCECHVFEAAEWEGEPAESEELKEQVWFNRKYLPLDRMMASDREWLPEVMSGRKIIAHAYIGEDQASLERKTEITEVGCFLED